jgi:hypothetical protein
MLPAWAWVLFRALGLVPVLDVAALLLGALWVLAPAVGDSTTAGAETALASIGEIGAASDGPAAATTAGGAIATSGAWTSAGASTAGAAAAVTSGMGASVCTDPVEIVPTDEPLAMKDWEICLGFAEYRTMATPTPVPKRMVSICSKTIVPNTPRVRRRVP